MMAHVEPDDAREEQRDRMNREFSEALAKNDTCPQCLGELDTGWECNDCGYDAIELAYKDLRDSGGIVDAP